VGKKKQEKEEDDFKLSPSPCRQYEYAKQPSYLLIWLLFIGNDKEDEGQFHAPKKNIYIQYKI